MKIHAINGDTGRTFCGRDHKEVRVTNGEIKVTCGTCLRVVTNALNKEELMENMEAMFSEYLDKRIPDLCSEVRFTGIAEHHMDAINELVKLTGPLPMVDEALDTLDQVQMVGVADRLANIKMEFQSCWSIVHTVRGKQCPKNMLKYRENTDEEIAGYALSQSIKRGMVTLQDIGWAVHVANKFGEPTSSIDEDNMKHWEDNKKRDRQLKSNDIEYADESLNLDIDDPIDRPAPIGKEATFTTEGDFGQVQIVEPTELKGEHGLYYDLWAEARTNKWDGSTYLDPQRGTRSAILSCVRELLNDRTFKVRGNKIVWKFKGFNGGLTAAAMRAGDSPKAPWKVALPLEMLYRHMGYKDDRFSELLSMVKGAMFPKPQEDCIKHVEGESFYMEDGSVNPKCLCKSSGGRIEGRTNWKTRQRLVRMWDVLKHDKTMPKHLIIKIWVHKDEEWRVALGLPSAPATPAKRTSIPAAKHSPPSTNINGGTAGSLPIAAG